jgi:hypothetical protein
MSTLVTSHNKGGNSPCPAFPQGQDVTLAQRWAASCFLNTLLLLPLLVPLREPQPGGVGCGQCFLLRSVSAPACGSGLSKRCWPQSPGPSSRQSTWPPAPPQTRAKTHRPGWAGTWLRSHLMLVSQDASSRQGSDLGKSRWFRNNFTKCKEPV